jgi:hypothetical protein
MSRGVEGPDLGGYRSGWLRASSAGLDRRCAGGSGENPPEVAATIRTSGREGRYESLGFGIGPRHSVAIAKLCEHLHNIPAYIAITYPGLPTKSVQEVFVMVSNRQKKLALKAYTKARQKPGTKRQDGARYPSGKLKPPAPTPACSLIGAS